MTTLEAIKTKFSRTPKTQLEARLALQRHPCCKCVVCGSRLVLAVLRPPCPHWMIHCNNCGSELPFHVALNREAWRKLKEANGHLKGGDYDNRKAPR